MKRKLLLALDFGGTKLAAGITEYKAKSWLRHRQILSPEGADAKQQFSLMLSLAHAVIHDVGQQPQAIGISFGGPVDRRSGLTRLSYHVDGWENVPLVTWVQRMFKRPTTLDNDANAAALGEYRFGAGLGCHHMLYVTVSTGIGGGWVIDGHPYDGADGLAGEIGHIQVQADGLPCECGRRGCLEAEASGPAIVHRARLYLEQQSLSADRLLQLADQNPLHISARMVSQAAAMGDPLSQTVLHDAATRLGYGLSTAINLMNPARVILGGSVTHAGDAWWETVRETAREQTMRAIPVGIMPTGLGNDAPLWGAIALAERVL